MYVFALPLRSIFSHDTSLAIEGSIEEHVRRLLAEHERRERADEWVTPAEMAKRLGISAEAVRKRAARGRLESRHHGRRLLVRLGAE